MLQVISALEGFPIEATDGRIGTVADFLFDDASWRVRWLVVECGTWLKGRKVLIPSSSVSYRLDDLQLDVKLTKSQVESSPELSENEPVAQWMESRAYSCYSLAPDWDAPYLSGIPGAMASPFQTPAFFGAGEEEPRQDREPDEPSRDSHLRSVTEVIGYRIHAQDGAIGHVENFMIDLADWKLQYFIVDTSNWWFGKRVLISLAAATTIEWSDQHVSLDVTQEQVKSSPPWDPMVAFSEIDRKMLHRHYGWLGSRE